MNTDYGENTITEYYLRSTAYDFQSQHLSFIIICVTDIVVDYDEYG